MSPLSSSSPSSASNSNALYHPIPQVPVAARMYDVLPEEDVEEDVDASQAMKSLPIDNRIWWIHYILGCAVLLPWNVLITATPYFLSQLRTSSLRTAFNSYLSISFTLANFIFVFFATVTAKQTSPSRRIFLSSTVLTFLVFLLTIHTFIKLPPTAFFFLILINSILQAAAGAYLQCAVVAIASLFGPTAMQACMSGQAGVAVAISSVQVLSAIASLKAPTSPDPNETSGTAEARAAMFFFAVSTIFLVGTILAQAWLIRMPAYRVAVVPDQDKSSSSSATGVTSMVGVQAIHLKGNVWRILKTNASFEFAASYVFLVTLAVFPPVTASIQPINQSFNSLLFNSIHFLIFSIGDLVGRYFCSFPRLVIWNPRKLCVYSLLRTVFIPLFLLCNIQKPSPSSPSSLSFTSTPFISSDALFFLILLFFGITNGYISSMSMMAAPSLEHNPLLKGRRDDVDLTATIMTFCMVGGLVVGSAMSFVVRGVICGCNPFLE